MTRSGTGFPSTDQSVTGGEPEPQCEGEREYPLTVRSVGQHFINQVCEGFRHAFAKARRAKPATLAAEPDSQFVLAAWSRAKYAYEAVLQDATFKIVTKFLGNSVRHRFTLGLAVCKKSLNVCGKGFV